MEINLEPVVTIKPISSSSDADLNQSVLAKPEVESIQSQVISLDKIFAEFLALEVGDGAASPDTIRNYLSHTKQYFNWCRDNILDPIEAITDDIKLYRQYLIEEEKNKPNTIATKLNIIRRFYQAAINKGLIETNPVEGIKAPTEKIDPASRITYLTEEELALLIGEIESRLEQAKTNKQRLAILRDRLLLGVMSLEGCRTVEMHSLQIKDIVRQGKRVGFRVEAKRSIRIVPLTDKLRSQLEEYLDIRRRVLRKKIKDDDPVFVSLSNQTKGKALSRRGIRAIIDNYLVATDLKYTPGRTISAHSLRHTAGTLAMRAGAGLRQVQDLLGHADPRTTSIYAHVGDRWENNPADAVEKKVFELPSGS